HTITDPSMRAGALGYVAETLAKVAATLAKAGLHEQAEAAVGVIASLETQSDASGMSKVAKILAKAGLHEQAQAAASSITEPDYRASALIQVVVAQVLAGEIRSAARVVAELCSSGRWRTALRPVFVLVPDASTMLIRILGETRSDKSRQYVDYLRACKEN